ncbi:unnamed protein product [Euphydryas editha]|uniref:FLYWCH-type domain-containing protein n=1 Tax=Euphydryas editha TaxID=104508 RepID=A0AAU9TGJ5_EUPED|nr:unnamed protein product [Euphydryas editha]
MAVYETISSSKYAQTQCPTGKIITLQNGKRPMLYEGYTYFKHYIVRGMFRWSCTKYPKCKAYLLGTENLKIHSKIITLENGKRPMLYEGYTYFKHYRVRGMFRWSCTRFGKCKAFVLAGDEDLRIHSVHNEHNHGIQNLYVSENGIYIKNKCFLKYNQFYYTKVTERKWRCIMTSKCFASIIVNEFRQVVEKRRVHMHPPPTFIISRSGNFDAIFLKSKTATITIKRLEDNINQLNTLPTPFRSSKSASRASSSCPIKEGSSDNNDNSKNSQDTKIRYNRKIENKRKRLRNLGQEYQTAKNKIKKARSVKTPCTNCRFKCTYLITEEERKELFNEYWNLGDLTLQRHYIFDRTESIEKYRYTRTMNAQQIFTEDGKTFLSYKGYHYSRVSSSNSRWRCVATKTCYVTLNVNPDFSLKREPKSHNHSPKILIKMSNGSYKFLSDWKERANENYKRVALAQSLLFKKALYGSNDITNEVKLITLANGKNYMLYKGYTYCFGFKTKVGCRWRCTLTSDYEVKLITLENGKNYMLYKGYTYCFGFKTKIGCRWRCNSATSDCKSFIVVSGDGTLLRAEGIHSHPKKRYHVLPDGRYVKI